MSRMRDDEIGCYLYALAYFVPLGVLIYIAVKVAEIASALNSLRQ